jgi:hypothetical protein
MYQDRPRVESIFLAALEKATGEERCAFLDGACGSDHELRERIDRLLAAPAKASDLPESLPLTVTAMTVTAGEPAPSECSGTAIGPYKLLEQIGEGGRPTLALASWQPVG